MKFKNLPPLSLLIWPYLVIPLFLNVFSDKAGSTYFIVYVFLTVAVYLGNIIFAFFQKDSHFLVFWNMIIKLSHIPFYLAVFVFGMSVMVAIPLLFVIDAALMVTTSAYGIKAVIRVHHENHLSLEHTVLLALGHLLFVSDVTCAIITYTRFRKHKE